jgi:acyl carrier protein
MEQKSNIEAFVIDAIQKSLATPISELSAASSLSAIGIDSLALMDLVFNIESAFQIEFSDQDLMPSNLKTVGSLAEVVDRIIQRTKG